MRNTIPVMVTRYSGLYRHKFNIAGFKPLFHRHDAGILLIVGYFKSVYVHIFSLKFSLTHHSSARAKERPGAEFKR